MTFMFFFIQVVMPGDFISQFADGCDAACREALRAQLGLDVPIWKRYLEWLGRLVRLDFGTSLTGEPVANSLKRVVPPTLLVFVTGTILSFLLGSWLGKVSAWSISRFPSRMVTLGGLTLFTSFPPWLAWIVSYAVGRGAGFVVMGERSGLRDVAFNQLDKAPWLTANVQPNPVIIYMLASFLVSIAVFIRVGNLWERWTGLEMPGLILLILIPVWTAASWELMGIERLAIDIMKRAYIPLITYVLLTFGETMLIMQTSLREVRRSDYIQTARAKGLPVHIVRDRHAVRNAILPVLSRLVVSLPYLLTGVVIIESSLNWPGMGTAMWNALYWQNMPIVMNTLLIVGVISLLSRLFLDVAGAYLDPRIRHHKHNMNLQ